MQELLRVREVLQPARGAPLPPIFLLAPALGGARLGDGQFRDVQDHYPVCGCQLEAFSPPQNVPFVPQEAGRRPEDWEGQRVQKAEPGIVRKEQV